MWCFSALVSFGGKYMCSLSPNGPKKSLRAHPLWTNCAHVFFRMCCSLSEEWHENCDSSVYFMIFVLELAVMQLSQLWGLGGWREHQSPHRWLLDTHTDPRAYATNTCMHNELWTTGFMMCEQQLFFVGGLGKQYLEPIYRYAIYYPICWNASLMVCQ